MSEEKRIVVIDGYIIAQFNSVGWWTCSKANKGDEDDFAVWPETAAGMRAARRIVGEVRVVLTSVRPIKRGDAWYTSEKDRLPKSYQRTLRMLAREVQG